MIAMTTRLNGGLKLRKVQLRKSSRLLWQRKTIPQRAALEAEMKVLQTPQMDLLFNNQTLEISNNLYHSTANYVNNTNL